MTEAKEYLSEPDFNRSDLLEPNPAHDFEDILNNIPDLICRFLPDTTIIYGNKAYEQAFSELGLAVIGQKISDFAPPDILADLLNSVNSLSRQNNTLNYHYQHFKISGKEIWLNWSIKRIETGLSSDPVIYQGVGKDVTELKLKEQKVEYLEKLKQFLIRVGVNFTNSPSEYNGIALKEMLIEMGELLEADRTYIFRFDEASGSFYNLLEWCRKGVTFPLYFGNPTPFLSIKADLLSLNKAGKYWTIDESQLSALEPATYDFFIENRIKGALVLPLFVEGKYFGCLGCELVEKPRNFSDDEVNLLKVLAEIISNTLLRAQKENALRESLLQNEMMLNLSPVGVAVIHNREVVYINPAGARIMDPSGQANLVGLKIKDMLGPVEFEKYLQWVKWLDTNERKIIRDDIKLIRLDGEPIYVDIAGTRLTYKGLNATLVMVDDITEQKRYEEEIKDLNITLEEKVRERTVALTMLNEQLIEEVAEKNTKAAQLMDKTKELESILAAIPDFLFRVRRDGTILAVHALDKTKHAFSISRIVGRNISELLPKEMVTKELNRMEHILKTGKGDITEFLYERDNERIYYESRVVPVSDDELISLVRDVSSEVLYKKSLEENIQREKELGDVKSRLVSMASHEFRTPLASILMFAETLLEYWVELDYSEVVHKLKGIIAQINYLTEIVKNTMQVSHIQESASNCNPESIDLLQLLRNIIDGFFGSGQSNRRIVWFEESFPEKIRVDKRIFIQMVTNLLSNALKYSSELSHVYLDCTADESTLSISIRDEGIGIPAEELKNLTEPFFRASNAESFEGTGLGLSIVKEGMNLHGGTLSITSKMGEGSCFIMPFPISITQDAPPHEIKLMD
ncbi:MAG: PAS domain S-box protein [Sphingobacteriia bacterium]|nr:PAS domain S-box protein [Sphingobacteriia bacterium]